MNPEITRELNRLRAIAREYENCYAYLKELIETNANHKDCVNTIKMLIDKYEE